MGKFEANDTVLVDIDPDDPAKLVFRKGAPLGLDQDPAPDAISPIESEPTETPITERKGKGGKPLEV